MVTFNTATQAVYDGLSNISNDALYFITDTHRIYRGSTLYTGIVQLVTSFPASGEVGVLYIAKSNLEGRIWQNGAWQTVALGYTSTVTEDATKLPTAQAVATYVTNAIATALGGSSSVISNITYASENASTSGTGNDERNLLITKSDGSEETVALSNLVSSVNYDSENLVLTFRLSGVADPVVVNLPQDNFIVSGTYDQATNNIVLTMKDGSTINIPASGLVDIYTGGTTQSITVSVSSGNVITANISVSASANNILSINSDGLYVPAPTSKMDKVSASASGQILTASATGDAEASGLTAGGATISSSPSSTVLATEAAVNAIYTTLQGSINNIQTSLASKVDTSDVTTTLNATNPSATLVTSESAVVAALTWRNLTT